jgi:transmembrane sensor
LSIPPFFLEQYKKSPTEMKNYHLYKTEDFILDESFADWVINDDPTAATFWEQWLVEHSEQQKEVEQARHLLLNIHNFQNTEGVSPHWIQEDVAHVLSKIQNTKLVSKPTFRLKMWRFISIAAALGLLVVVGLGVWKKEKTVSALASYEGMVQANKAKLLEKTNDLDKAASVLLPDGSIVFLEKGAKVSYPSAFAKDNRTVYLVGDAFFDVMKDAKKPFLIYANNTVTKVVGTSFRIQAKEGVNEVTVSVKSGKVLVYKQKDFESLKNKPNTEGDKETKAILLTPNQQATLNIPQATIEKTIVEKPTLIAPQATSQVMNFDETSVSTVLKSLQNMYGIDIVFDEETLDKCPITCSFEDENLHERLNFICQAIRARYEIVEGKIIFSGVCR